MPTAQRLELSTATVSIRARFLGRAMLPPDVFIANRLIVSIRARFLGRAMPRYSDVVDLAVTPCFNPRPVFRPGDAVRFSRVSTFPRMFQSAPGF